MDHTAYTFDYFNIYSKSVDVVLILRPIFEVDLVNVFFLIGIGFLMFLLWPLHEYHVKRDEILFDNLQNYLYHTNDFTQYFFIHRNFDLNYFYQYFVNIILLIFSWPLRVY